MPRWFNTAGFCNPQNHYMIPALRRLPELRGIIDRQGYFVLHAPRQVGKTTSLLSLAAELTAEGRYAAVLVSMLVGAGSPGDTGAAELAILDSWRKAAQIQLPPELQPPPWPDAPPAGRIGAALGAWAKASPRPLVVFLDEVDALRDSVLLSVLRQLQEGYRNRPDAFPSSLALIGLRDVSDYKIAEDGREHLGTASPFNIMVRSITLRNFTRDEVAELYQQHTDDTGQGFEAEAVDQVFALTQGQPWIVNALALEIVDTLVTDRAKAITVVDVNRAKEILLSRRETHWRSLTARVREPRIKSILEPMLAGSELDDVPEDDRQFALDLGLIRHDTTGGLVMANPMYREVIARVLTSGPQDSMPQIKPIWLKPDGSLDRDRLLDSFLAFWRQHAEPLLGTTPYHEVAPHLVLMAYLHRVANGGGTIEREYAVGRGRLDLCVRYRGEILAIELKVWRDKRADPLGEGLEQIDEYLAGLGVNEGWLVIFDRRTGAAALAERTAVERAQTAAGRDVVVIRG